MYAHYVGAFHVLGCHWHTCEAGKLAWLARVSPLLTRMYLHVRTTRILIQATAIRFERAESLDTVSSLRIH
jgi:hypothetical protein